MKQLITLFLVLQCFVVMLPFIPVAEAAEQELMPVIQADDLKVQLQNYFIDHEISEDLVSVGYIYTATGESWYYHPDQWYYSASLYKVPLMMLYAEKEAEGELNQETEFFNMPLSEIEDEVLTFSNNSIAYSMMLTLAQPDACRRMFQRYASLPEEYYSWDFYASSYFSARFMTEVMNTLYSEPDRFPGIAERLMEAQPGHYFRLKLDETGVSVAQKYGNYHDEEGYDWNHTTGIIYTEHPFILTVMTRYGGISETIISDLAQLFYEYTLQAEQRILLLQKEAENEGFFPGEPSLSGSSECLWLFSRMT